MSRLRALPKTDLTLGPPRCLGEIDTTAHTVSKSCDVIYKNKFQSFHSYRKLQNYFSRLFTITEICAKRRTMISSCNIIQIQMLYDSIFCQNSSRRRVVVVTTYIRYEFAICKFVQSPIFRNCFDKRYRWDGNVTLYRNDSRR